MLLIFLLFSNNRKVMPIKKIFLLQSIPITKPGAQISVCTKPLAEKLGLKWTKPEKEINMVKASEFWMLKPQSYKNELFFLVSIFYSPKIFL